MSTGSFIDDLQDIIDNPTTSFTHETPKADNRERFPCESCRGTGRYQGARIHQQQSECFACKGKGYFFKSYADRLASRNKAKAKKVSILQSSQADFHAAYPNLIEGLRALVSWNSFAASLVEQFDARGSLSEKQATIGYQQIEKAAARDAERAAAKAKLNVAVDASNIKALFDKALAKGLQKPGLWFGEIKLSLAASTSANAGAIYVKKGNAYQGKVIDGVFKPVYGADATIGAMLLAVAGNPAEELRRIGRETGTCCCCGRELTDPVSVAAGIGPICASNWGV